MKIIADLQIHSRYARGTSNDLTINNLEKYARLKGLGLLGTGDFQHPKWFEEIRTSLTEDEHGILWTKNKFPFIWQTEISLIYTQGGKGRRVHHLILSPSIEISKQIIEALGKKGRLDYDGRPIFGFNSIELVDMMQGIDNEIEIIPAHCWTPWFSIFGSKSGFDSVEECFADNARHIHAIETGLSSDPLMNWRISGLDKYTLVSNSDAHSYWPWRLGRECNVFDFGQLSYRNIIKAIREREGFVETIEVNPSYGKYHYDGHRNCGVSFNPAESKKHNNICPKCKRPLTIGVLNRVEELADREEGYRPADAIPFKSLIPLSELLASLLGIGVASKGAWQEYNKLIGEFGNEFNVLLEADYEAIKNISGEAIAKAIIDNREGKIEIIPGYDGEYGRPVLGKQGLKAETTITKTEKSPQRGLGDFI